MPVFTYAPKLPDITARNHFLKQLNFPSSTITNAIALSERIFAINQSNNLLQDNDKLNDWLKFLIRQFCDKTLIEPIKDLEFKFDQILAINYAIESCDLRKVFPDNDQQWIKENHLETYFQIFKEAIDDPNPAGKLGIDKKSNFKNLYTNQSIPYVILAEDIRSYIKEYLKQQSDEISNEPQTEDYWQNKLRESRTNSNINKEK